VWYLLFLSCYDCVVFVVFELLRQCGICCFWAVTTVWYLLFLSCYDCVVFVVFHFISSITNLYILGILIYRIAWELISTEVNTTNNDPISTNTRHLQSPLHSVSITTNVVNPASGGVYNLELCQWRLEGMWSSLHTVTSSK
jgi:hypothetical protein